MVCAVPTELNTEGSSSIRRNKFRRYKMSRADGSLKHERGEVSKTISNLQKGIAHHTAH